MGGGLGNNPTHLRICLDTKLSAGLDLTKNTWSVCVPLCLDSRVQALTLVAQIASSMASTKRLAPIPRALQELQQSIDDYDEGVRTAGIDVIMRFVPFHTVSAAPTATAGKLPLRQYAHTLPEERCVYVEPDRQTIVAIDPQAAPSAPVSQRQSRQRLDLGVHAESSNSSVCSTLAQVALQQWLLQGFNTNIIAFGRAGTGKSTLLFGDATHGTGNVAADAGFDDIFSTCLAAAFRSDAAKQEYMCTMSAWELHENGAFDLLSTKPSTQALPLRPSPCVAAAAVPAASVLCTSAGDAQRLLLAAKARSASWSPAPHRLDAMVPTPAASHMVVALRLLHVPSGRAAVLHIVDVGGWAAASRLGTAHDAPPRGATADPSAARIMRRQGYCLRQWLRNLGSAARSAAKGVRGGSTSTAPGAHLRLQALAVPGAKDTPLNKMLSWLVLGNAKTFLVGCASCGVRDYFDTLGTLRCLAAAAAVQVPIVPCTGATAAGLGALLSLSEVLPDSIAQATGHPLASQVYPSSTSQAAKTATTRRSDAAATTPDTSQSPAVSADGGPAAAAAAGSAGSQPPPATDAGGHQQQKHSTHDGQVQLLDDAQARGPSRALDTPPPGTPPPRAPPSAPVSAADSFVSRPLQPALFNGGGSTAPSERLFPVAAAALQHTSASGHTMATATADETGDAAVARLLASDTRESALQGSSLLDLAAQMNALVGDLLRPDTQGHRQGGGQTLPAPGSPAPNHSSECALDAAASSDSTAMASAAASDTVSLYSVGEAQGGVQWGGYSNTPSDAMWQSRSPSAASMSSSVTQHTADIAASAAAMQRLSNPPSGASTPTGTGGAAGNRDAPAASPRFDGVASCRPLPSRALPAAGGGGAPPVAGDSAPPSDSDEEEAFHSALLGGGLHDSLVAAMGVAEAAAQQQHAASCGRGDAGGGPNDCPPPSHRSLAAEADSHTSADSLDDAAAGHSGTALVDDGLADRVGDIILRHAMAGHPLGGHARGASRGSSLSSPPGATETAAPLSHTDTILLQEEHRQLSEQHARLQTAHSKLQGESRQLAATMQDTATTAAEVKVQAAADVAGARADAKAAQAALRAAGKRGNEALWEWYESLLDKANAEAEHFRRQNTQLSLKLAAQTTASGRDSGDVEGEGGQGGVVTVPRATWLRTQRLLSSTLKRNTALEAAQNKRNKGDRVAAATHRRLHRVTSALARAQASALTALTAAEGAQLNAAAATADRDSTRSGLLSAKAAAVLAGEQVALLQGEIAGLRSYMSQSADSAIALPGLHQHEGGAGGELKQLKVALSRAQGGVPATPKGAKGGYGAIPSEPQQPDAPCNSELVPWEPTRPIMQAGSSAAGVGHGGGSSGTEHRPPLAPSPGSEDPSLEMRAAFSALLHDAAEAAPALIPRLQALQSRVYRGGAAASSTLVACAAGGQQAQQAQHGGSGGSAVSDGIGAALLQRTLPQAQWGPAWQHSLRSTE